MEIFRGTSVTRKGDRPPGLVAGTAGRMAEEIEMKQIEFIADFAHAADGINAIPYAAGQVAEVSDACAAAAIRTGAGREPGNALDGAADGAGAASSSSAPGPAQGANGDEKPSDSSVTDKPTANGDEKPSKAKAQPKADKTSA